MKKRSSPPSLKVKRPPKIANESVGKSVPHGRDEVKKSILDATESLLLRYSPNKISVRKIAEVANVKHPLIYRHFRTKDRLIMEALTRGLTQIAKKELRFDQLEGNVGRFFKTARNNRFRLPIARAMIDGVDPRQMQDQFPLSQKLLDLMKKREAETNSKSKFGVQFSAAALTALALGWMLYEPILLASSGLEDESRESIDRTIIELLEDFIQKMC